MRGKRPSIVWGGNTLVFAYPLDNAVAYSVAREGSEYVRLGSGAVDSWVKGTDHILEGDVRWISTTEWEKAGGWRDLLAHCRDAGLFSFRPDYTNLAVTYSSCLLLEPMQLRPELEPDGSRKLRIQIASPTVINGY